LAVLAELSKSDPDNPVVLSALGHEALQRGEPAAVDYLSRALERNKEFPTTMLVVDLAEALARTGRSQEAIRVLTDAVERSPYASILYKALMLRYGALREMPQLLEITKKYLDVFPEDVEIRALLPRMERAVR
jgi:predicted Zn-dependent protease